MRLLLLVAVAAVLASSSEAKPRGLHPVRPQVPSGSHAVKWEGAVSPQELGQEKCVGCRPGTKRQNPLAGFVAESSSSVSPMIIGGGTATIKQLPWMALITMDDTYICGGSLISEMFILTSAQCVSGYNKFKVALGDVSRYYPSSSYRYVYTYKRIVHEDFEEDNYLNDIGLLQLLYPIQLSDAILPVKLPSSADVTTDFAGVKGTVSGYGYTSSNYEAYTLRYLEHVILKNERCVRFFPNYVTGKNICGDGEGGVGTCISDSGDPLVIQGDDGAWVQVGVSSFQSELGCSYGYPSVYTRVTEFLQWIQSKTDLKL